MRKKLQVILIILFLVTTFTYAQDTDGDGVLDTTEVPNGTDPNDSCSYNVQDVTEIITAGLDCDGDGVLDATEIANATNPLDSCDYAWQDQDFSAVSAEWDSLDCDGDGVTNEQEIIDATDPSKNCDYIDSSITLTVVADTDNDGDGVLNCQERLDGTSIYNNCDYLFSSITVTPTNYCERNTITGQVQLDLTGDGCDASDAALNNIRVTSTSSTNTYTTFTQIDGTYSQTVDEGDYTTTIQNYPISTNYTFTPTSHDTSFLGSDNTDVADFCVIENQIAHDIELTVYGEEVRPGFDTTYRVYCKNVGTTVVNGSITFTYDNSKLTFVSTTVAQSSSTANTYTFDYNLNPFERQYIRLKFNIMAPPINNIGEVLNFNVIANPVTGDITPGNNEVNFNQTLIGSYDPNDITCTEGDRILIEDAGKYLHYLIRFQNTGTADAIHVNVTNELDAKLDWDTFQLEDMSHTGITKIRNGNEVQFRFDNIHLPDSTTDEPASHGYIAYKIKPKSDVVLGDIINNQAQIFFDFNLPIITNIASTEFVQALAVNENTLTDVSIYPNPVKDILQIESNQETIVEVKVFNRLGKLVKEIKNSNGIEKIDISNLENDMYFVKLLNVNQLNKVVKILKL